MLYTSSETGITYDFINVSIDYINKEEKRGFILACDVNIKLNEWKYYGVCVANNDTIPKEFQHIIIPAINSEELMRQFIIYYENEERKKEKL